MLCILAVYYMSSLYGYTTFCLSRDKHLTGSICGIIMNNASMCIHAEIFIWTYVFVFLR